MVALTLAPFLAALASMAPRAVDADAFLHRQDVDMESVSAQAVEQTLMTELALVGRDQHLQELQDELRPMYEALPKNSEGRLDESVVRYALHRFFVQARGWSVQGLQPSGELRNASMPVKIMKDRVPGFIQKLLEQRVRGQGLQLPELAAFAATVQDLVHTESVQHLRDVFEAVEMPWDSALTDEAAAGLTDFYFMHYIVEGGGKVSGPRLETLRDDIADIYPAFPDVAMWTRDLRQTLNYQWQGRRNPFVSASTGFEELADFVREAGHRFGSFQDQECRTMKASLVDLEYRGTGRVRLSEFYKGGLEGNWQFAESVEYLRAVGALDESNPAMASVLIANYVGSQSNCLASSGFYSVCCLDECEGLLGQLEVAIGAPTAEPEQIARLLSSMPSDTVDAPRNLSSALLSRLEEIAQYHGGRVPLHGRLFAQLMHHAYPRECPFPHTAGSTNPMTPEEWMTKNGSVVASEQDMAQHVSAGRNATQMVLADELEALPWTSIEELVAVREPAQGGEGSLAGLLSKFVLLVAFACLVAPSVLGAEKRREARESDSKVPKYLV